MNAPDKIYIDRTNPFINRSFTLSPYMNDIEYLRSDLAAHWVSVKERLPERVDLYLVHGSHRTWFGKFNGKEFEMSVTHWLDSCPTTSKEE